MKNKQLFRYKYKKGQIPKTFKLSAPQKYLRTEFFVHDVSKKI